MNFTGEQKRAIHARGDSLVLAGAGSGKTRTLVERCAQILLDPENSVSARNILVVTFNEAAAAELRERLRRRLEEIATELNDPRVMEQLALLDSAPISTLHSFCYALLREHFFELELDPAVSILDETQAQILFLKTIEDLLREHYAGLHPFSGDLKEFLRTHLRGWEKPLIGFVRKVHEFTQTRPDPQGWFDRQFKLLGQDECTSWQDWYREALQEWAAWWLPWLRQLPADNVNGRVCADLLAKACESGDTGVIAEIMERDQCWPKGKKTAHRAPLEAFFKEAEFLASLQPGRDPGKSPLQQDWEWARPPLELLLKLSAQFAQRFSEAKQERCVLDFHDLEQGALRLLWTAGRPSEIAEAWQRRFHAVFVDEYQDINAVQDRILTALSRPGPPGNRFLVGDNKQSIYRFRQADPAIFQKYLAASEGWLHAYLSENFRSHEGILNFINPWFTWLMRKSVGGVEYDSRSSLKFADTPERSHLKCRDGEKQVELHVIFSDAENNEPADEEGDDRPNLAEAEKEARLIAARLLELRTTGFQIIDAASGQARAVEWRDMVVLLRSAAGKLEAYSKAFEAFGVPLQTKQNAFYTTQEVLDLCSLLHILDNPLQDIPLVAVLRSPLCGLSANELASIRIESDAKPFWRALRKFADSKKDLAARPKVERFLELYHAWRRDHSCASLSQRLERILADTGYDEWLLGQPRGRQRYANVQQLVRIARQFDEVRGESLYLFLRHIEEIQEAVGDIEPAVAVHENGVRLMTVHQSKGLEFPVVVLPDLGKAFNRADSTEGMIIDETFGLCTMIKPPKTGQRYPSLPLWLARRKERVATAGEEIRLLYVALTRAQNHLILAGTTREARADKGWSLGTSHPLPHHTLKAFCWLDWLGAWTHTLTPNWWKTDDCESSLFAARIHRTLAIPEPQAPEARPDPGAEVDVQVIDRRLGFAYPHAAATMEAAKTSVSTLRRRAEEQDQEARPGFLRLNRKQDGRTRGLACHTFLEHLDLEGWLDAIGLATQAARMPMLQKEERAMLDFESLAQFWNSTLGRDILRERLHVHRELEFTCKLAAESLRGFITVPEGEYVILQGIVDLAVILSGEIWLLDFKTDEVKPSELKKAVEPYRPQLALYAAALTVIYARPVTRKGFYFVSARELVWA